MRFKTVFHVTQVLFLNSTALEQISVCLAQLRCLSVVSVLRLQSVLNVFQPITTLQRILLVNCVEYSCHNALLVQTLPLVSPVPQDTLLAQLQRISAYVILLPTVWPIVLHVLRPLYVHYAFRTYTS